MDQNNTSHDWQSDYFLSGWDLDSVPKSLTLSCIQPALALKDDWKAASS